MMPECVSYSPLFRQGDFFVRNSNRLSAMHKATPNIAYTKKPVYEYGLFHKSGRHDWTRTNDPHHVKDDYNAIKSVCCIQFGVILA